jgi:SRSO17 transposase
MKGKIQFQVHQMWAVEECNEQGKDLIGLDQHQVRTWTAFHHYVTVCMFAHAFAATRRARLHHDGQDTTQGAHRENDSTPSPTRRRQPAVSGGT